MLHVLRCLLTHTLLLVVRSTFFCLKLSGISFIYACVCVYIYLYIYMYVLGRYPPAAELRHSRLVPESQSPWLLACGHSSSRGQSAVPSAGTCSLSGGWDYPAYLMSNTPPPTWPCPLETEVCIHAQSQWPSPGPPYRPTCVNVLMHIYQVS